MQMQTTAAELAAKHRDLKKQIADEMTKPALDLSRVGELKRQKLKIKDALASLSPSHPTGQ